MSILFPVLKKVGEGYEYLTIENFKNRLAAETKQATLEFMDDLWKDLHLLFDKCIDQYYKYTTRRYYRHDVGRGTGTGSNLYRAIDEKYSGYTLRLKISSSDMAGYKPYKDKEGSEHSVDAGYVLNNVMSGIRGLPYSASRYGGDSMSWSASVSTNLFGNLSGTINDILDTIEDKFPDIGSKYIADKVLERII